MARQGSLCQRIFQSRCELSPLGILCALLIAQFTLSDAATRADEAGELIDIRLRCEWGSKDARFWKVRLSVVDSKSVTPSISEVDNYSRSEETSGAFELSSDNGTLSVQPRHAMLGGAMQLRIRASLEAKLRIEVSGDQRNDSSSGSPQAAKEIPLAEIIDSRSIRSDPSDSSPAPMWSLTRIAGDELRTENIREVPFFEPGSPFTFSVRSNALVRHASQVLTLEYSLYRVSQGEIVSSHRWPIKVDSRGNSLPITINEPAPELPGVYEVRCQIAKDDDNIWSRLRRPDPPVVRVSYPIVVLSQQAGQSQVNEPQPWHSAGEIRPSESSWSVDQWLPKQTTRLIPGAGQQSIGEQGTPNLASVEYAGESTSLIQPNDTFQATLPIVTPGLPHKVTIRFPTARATRIRVDVAGANDRANPVVSFVLASDPVSQSTGQWKTHTFVHYPTNDDQIWLTNLNTSSPAAFESIAVQAGPSHLTSRSKAEAPQRTAMLRLPNIDWVDSLVADLSKLSSLSDCDPKTIALYRLWVASDRLSDYALANGMNGIMVPANSVARTWFDSARLFPRHVVSEQEVQLLQIFMQLMQPRNLDVFVALQPNMLLSDLERSTGKQRSLSHPLTHIRGGSSGQYNPLDPHVQESLAALVGEIQQQCNDYSCFAGIALQCDMQSHLEPFHDAPHDLGTLALFAQSNSQTVSAAHLRTWAEQQGKPALDTWLRDRTRRAYKSVGESSPNRPLLMVMPKHSGSNGRNETDATDIRLFAQQGPSKSTSLVPTESFCYGPARVLAKKSLLQQQLASVAAPEATADAPSATVAALLGAEINDDSSEPTLVRDQLIADISRIIDRLDPWMLSVELPMIARRLDDELTQTIRSFAATPNEKKRRIDPIDPAMQTIHVSSRTNDGHLYVSMISLAPWTSEVELESSAPIEWVLLGDEHEPRNTQSILQTSGTHARVVVPPGQLIAVKSATATSANIKSWSSRISGGPEALEQIKQKVTLIVERIGILSDFESYDALTNGGFEQRGGMGLVGWLHAQHPPGCVRIDDQEYVEGKHSVLLTTSGVSATRTWLVSETIDPPDSGRLAVSLACRGELKENDKVHRLRVSIEATRDSEPIRYACEFDVPCNGQWGSREVVLEADGIDPARVDSLRLTIDSLSKGRVWIDDVHLHDQFPTAKERAELQSQAFLAVQGLQRGNLTPSGRLLQNHWARHLLAQGPPPQRSQVIKAVEPPEKTPGVADRIRSWLPRPLRF